MAAGALILLAAVAVAGDVFLPQGGVFEVDGREVWLGAFNLDNALSPEGTCAALPSADERRIAARLPSFVPSGSWERLASPPDEACGYTSAVVEAEGVDGYLWYGGWADHLGESEVIAGQGDPRDGVIRIHQNPFHFWGEEAKPAPRGERCVVRAPATEAAAWVDASSLNLRTGRGAQFPVVLRLDAGAPLRVLHREVEWAWVSAPREVTDDSGSEGAVIRRCEELGWVSAAYLSATAPDGAQYARDGQRALAERRVADAVAPLERAAALYPGSAALREMLADVYTQTGHAEAARAVQQAAALRQLQAARSFAAADPLVGLATVCRGEPSTVPWVAARYPTAEGDACLLPFSPDGTTPHLPGVVGWVDLDRSNLQAQCGAGAPPGWQELAVAPTTLFVKVAPGDEGRAVHLRVRPLLGTADEGDLDVTGPGPWSTAVLRAVDAQGAVIEVPMAELLGDAVHAVELELEVFTRDGHGALVRTALLWPVTC
jgi:hypothetical protein